MSSILNIEINQIQTGADQLCQKIITDLPEYFGIPEANEHYVHGVLNKNNFIAQVDNNYVGLISIDFPYPNNANIYWMGVMRNYHRQGTGKILLNEAMAYALSHNATTMTVETLAPAECDENYLKTYKFYCANDFKPLFNLKPIDYDWNMVYMLSFLLNTCLSKD